jgi:predicted GNAT family acetyltransferase
MRETVEPRFVDNPDEERYELWVGDARVGVLEYETEVDARSLIHAEVEPELRRRGLAARLVEGALQDLRTRGLKAKPLCSYVEAYIRRHPEHQDLVVARRASPPDR